MISAPKEPITKTAEPAAAGLVPGEWPGPAGEDFLQPAGGVVSW